MRPLRARGPGLLLVALALAANCQSTSSCKTGTLLVKVTFDTVTSGADQIEVDVRVANGSPKLTTLGHQPGQSEGSIEIDFPNGSGYPAGQGIDVTVIALNAGTTLGMATSGVAALPDACGTLAIVFGGSVGAGGAGGAGAGGSAAPGGRTGGSGGAAAGGAAGASTPGVGGSGAGGFAGASPAGVGGAAGPPANPCLNTTCSGHGTCASGACTCSAGYTGAACDACAPGFLGYPACQPDPCNGNTCSGHGTCGAGVCTCTAGFAGPTCGQCATGFQGYPSCAACTCTTGQLQCNGASAINECTNGCTWTSTNCAPGCQQAGFVDKSSGCAVNMSTGKDQCWCPATTSEDVMLWSFVDMCNDGVTPSVAFFDTTLGPAVTAGPFSVQPFNQELSLPLDCITGDKICWGAWQAGGSQFWGCGLGCAQICTNCCFTCGAQLTIQTQNLNCSR